MCYFCDGFDGKQVDGQLGLITRGGSSGYSIQI